MHCYYYFSNGKILDKCNNTKISISLPQFNAIDCTVRFSRKKKKKKLLNQRYWNQYSDALGFQSSINFILIVIIAASVTHNINTAYSPAPLLTIKKCNVCTNFADFNCYWNYHLEIIWKFITANNFIQLLAFVAMLLFFG